MKSAIAKQVFGVPSTEATNRIETSDKVAALHAAEFRYRARLRELEQMFEAKAATLRTEYLTEVAAIGEEDQEG